MISFGLAHPVTFALNFTAHDENYCIFDRPYANYELDGPDARNEPRRAANHR